MAKKEQPLDKADIIAKKKAIKALSAADCTDHAFNYARRQWKTLLPVLLLFHAPFILAQGMLVTDSAFKLILIDSFLYGESPIGAIISILIGELILTIYYGLFFHVVNGAVMYSAYRYTFFGEKTILRLQLRRGFKLALNQFILSMVAGTILGGVVLVLEILVMMIIRGVTSMGGAVSEQAIEALAIAFVSVIGLIGLGAIIVFIYFLMRFSYAVIYVVVENKNIFEGLKESWKNTKFKFRRIFSIYVATLVCTAGISVVVGSLSAGGVLTSSFMLSAAGAVINVFASLGAFLIQLALTFSYMHDKEKDENIVREQELVRFFEENGV